MEIRLDRNAFAAALAPMQGIVEHKATTPLPPDILLTARAGRVQLAAGDLDLSVTSWCDAELAGGGGIAVPAHKLMEIVRALDGNEVRLALDEPESLTILAGPSSFRLHGKVPGTFPALPDVGPGPEAVIPLHALKRIIVQTIFAIVAEESRLQLNGALLQITGGSIGIVATDGLRLALVERPLTTAGEVSVLVPRKALVELQQFEGDGGVRFRRGEHHLSFRFGRLELICRILQGQFPDYESEIPRDNDKKAVFDRRRLAAAVGRVALLNADKYVNLHLTSNKLVISAQDPALGDAREEVARDYAGAELQLGIMPGYLCDFLSAIDSDKVRLEMKDADTPCVGYPEGGDAGGRCLWATMPRRI